MRIQKALIVAAILLVIGLLAASAYWYIINVPKQKAVSGISYYQFPVVVEFVGQTTEVSPLGNFFFLTDSAGVQTLTVTNQEGELVISKDYNLEIDPAIYIELLGSEAQLQANQMCLVQADVTDVYYLLPQEAAPAEPPPLATNIQLLEQIPSTSFLVRLGRLELITDSTLFPGRLDIKALPPQIEQGQRITAFFPVRCADASNAELVTNQLNAWRYFEEGLFSDFNWDTLLR